MNIKNIFIIVLFFTLFLKYQTITGVVTVLGTHNFPDIVIQSNNTNYYLDNKLFDEYIKYHTQTITVRGKVKKEKLWLADRSESFYRYYLLDVKMQD